MCKKKENGYILITALLLLLVLTVAGMAALGTSTIENMLSGNLLVDEQHDSESDSGILYPPIIIPSIVVENYTPTDFNNIIKDANFYYEMRSVPYAFNTLDYSMSDPIDSGPDLQFNTRKDNNIQNTIDIDVDKLDRDAMEGGGQINHNCYKGAGKCAGKGSIYHYRINSRAYNTSMGSESVTASYYRYVDK